MKSLIKRDDLKPLIDKHFYPDLTAENYEVKRIKAERMLTWNRLDLGFKLLYLETLAFQLEFGRSIYKDHLRAFSLGRFEEPGNDAKRSFEKYVEDFNRIFEAITGKGFDPKESLIPVSRNGSVANGAHRLAAAIYLDKEVSCVEFDTNDHIYDYKFFYQRNVSSDALDAAVTKFIEYSSNTYIAFIWPVAVGRDEDIDSIIPKVVYRKEVDLNQNGAHNLISQIYKSESWLGTVEDNFLGSRGKLAECYKIFSPVRIIAFQADNLDDALEIKNRIRAVFNIGKHSIHITDTHEEAIRTARVVFNNNAVHFLNFARPNRYLSAHGKISEFKDFLKSNGLSSDEVLLDTGMVLSIYGLREARDIDFFTVDNNAVTHCFNEINTHDEELKHYATDKLDLIFNPRRHFYFEDLKFVSFFELYRMKLSRAEEKDLKDTDLMAAFIEDNSTKFSLSKIKQIISYEKIKLRKKFVEFLKTIGCYATVRKYYRKLKNH